MAFRRLYAKAGWVDAEAAAWQYEGLRVIEDVRYSAARSGSKWHVIRLDELATSPSPTEIFAWWNDLDSISTPAKGIKNFYERLWTGSENRRVVIGTGADEIAVWADGIDPYDAMLLDAKYVKDPARSPFIPGSGIPDRIRPKILGKINNEFSRYKAVISDPGTPVTGLRIYTNNPDAAGFFRNLLRTHEIQGEVILTLE